MPELIAIWKGVQGHFCDQGAPFNAAPTPEARARHLRAERARLDGIAVGGSAREVLETLGLDRGVADGTSVKPSVDLVDAVETAMSHLWRIIIKWSRQKATWPLRSPKHQADVTDIAGMMMKTLQAVVAGAKPPRSSGASCKLRPTGVALILSNDGETIDVKYPEEHQLDSEGKPRPKRLRLKTCPKKVRPLLKVVLDRAKTSDEALTDEVIRCEWKGKPGLKYQDLWRAVEEGRRIHKPGKKKSRAARGSRDGYGESDFDVENVGGGYGRSVSLKDLNPERRPTQELRKAVWVLNDWFRKQIGDRHCSLIAGLTNRKRLPEISEQARWENAPYQIQALVIRRSA